MSAQSDDHNMAGVEDATTLDKGKGKAPEVAETMEESADDSSDESGAEEGGEPEPEEDDNMEEIEEANIVGRRTRGRNIDFAKAAAELDEDDEDDDDDDFVDPDDQMKE